MSNASIARVLLQLGGTPLKWRNGLPANISAEREGTLLAGAANPGFKAVGEGSPVDIYPVSGKMVESVHCALVPRLMIKKIRVLSMYICT